MVIRIGHPLTSTHTMQRLSETTLTILLVVIMSAYGTKKDSSHSRQKRLLWITEDGRLALPPGSHLVITPSLSLPFVRYPPDGFFSNMTISLPFTIDFDKLGLTDNENPYGAIPTLLARSMGRSAGSYLANYVGQFVARQLSRPQRDIGDQQVHEYSKVAFHGGERAILYILLEDLLENFGMNGKACLLRAICEVHAYPLKRMGLIGEMLKLFFTASNSPFSEHLTEYVTAEKNGKDNWDEALTKCKHYTKDCPRSIFGNKPDVKDDSAANEIPSSGDEFAFNM